MAGWEDTIFGNLPFGWGGGPAQPMMPPRTPTPTPAPTGYQATPTSGHIEDQRNQPTDFSAALQDAAGYLSYSYMPTDIGPDAHYDASDPGPYPLSFSPRYRPRLNSFPSISPDYGPRIPHPLDPIWFQGFSPGSPGWRTPPSPSGPHPLSAQPAGEGVQPPIYTGGGDVLGALAYLLRGTRQ